MIDVTNEQVITLNEAARILPKRPHVSCLYRWTKQGCRGVVLESVQVGGTRCTSKEALQRFCERLTDWTRCNPKVRSESTRRRSAGRASKRLEELGF